MHQVMLVGRSPQARRKEEKLVKITQIFLQPAAPCQPREKWLRANDRNLAPCRLEHPLHPIRVTPHALETIWLIVTDQENSHRIRLRSIQHVFSREYKCLKTSKWDWQRSALPMFLCPSRGTRSQNPSNLFALRVSLPRPNKCAW